MIILPTQYKRARGWGKYHARLLSLRRALLIEVALIAKATAKLEGISLKLHLRFTNDHGDLGLAGGATVPSGVGVSFTCANKGRKTDQKGYAVFFK